MPESKPKKIAWGSVSFPIPQNWELALYKRFKRKIWHLEIEDEYSLRIEVEWIEREEKQLDVETILERYKKATHRISDQAANKQTVDGLPADWTATYYTFVESEKAKSGNGLETIHHGLVTAFCIPPDKRFFCFVLFHFHPDNTDENPARMIRSFASGFQRHTGELIPWQMFDVAFKLPRDFLLENTSFGIGSKLTVFRWRMRRFYLWHFSCAHMFLKDTSPEKWISGFLNDFQKIRGIVFEPGPAGTVRWRRKKRHVFGHRDELSRGCLKYEIRYFHDRKRDRLVLWVFNYRKPDDLNQLPQPFMFAK
ncbi:MAG: hypothetical protein ACOCUY_03240 [Verrucomicrobiota bacterium]